jgi:FkbM family methyltransferase
MSFMRRWNSSWRWALVAAVAAVLGYAVGVLGLGWPGHGALAHQRWRAERLARIERGVNALLVQLSEARSLAPWYNHPGKHQFLDAVADCVTTDRVGKVGDGGKWVCNAYKLPHPCVVYGMGAGLEISFEIAMARDYGCEVHVFDPTPSVVKRFADYTRGRSFGAGSVTFHPWGVGPVSDQAGEARGLVLEGQVCETKTVSDIVAALGQSHVDVLKIDIEGSEFPVFDDLFARNLLKRLRVTQLMVEFHVPDPAHFVRQWEIIDTLTRDGYLLFRKELNPFNGGWCAEYAFAERSFLVD